MKYYFPLCQRLILGIIPEVARIGRHVLVEFHTVEFGMEDVSKRVRGIPPGGVGVFTANVAFPGTVGIESKAQFLHYTYAHNVRVAVVSPCFSDKRITRLIDYRNIHWIFFACHKC